eukprot:m51a1_g7124 hypothetical protein (340) ;mRNA; r:141729-150010
MSEPHGLKRRWFSTLVIPLFLENKNVFEPQEKDKKIHYDLVVHFLTPAARQSFLDSLNATFVCVPVDRTEELYRSSMLHINESYPNALTLPVCVATALVIACKMELRVPVLKQIGDLSYSVYLYHWPIIILCRHYMGVSMSTKPAWLASLVLTAMFSSASYWLIDVFVVEPLFKKLVGPGGVYAPVVPEQRLHIRSNSVVFGFNGDSHMIQFWKPLYNYGDKLGVSMYVGGVNHNDIPNYEVMWNPPELWSPARFATRVAFLNWRVLVQKWLWGQAPWESDYKRYARQWIEKSNCTVILVDNPFPDIGWMRSLLSEYPELRGRVEMVSFNDLVCWDSML